MCVRVDLWTLFIILENGNEPAFIHWIRSVPVYPHDGLPCCQQKGQVCEHTKDFSASEAEQNG